MPEFQLEQWSRDQNSLAALVPADELFGLLAREVIVPAGVAALGRREEGDYLLAREGERLSAHALTEVLWVKSAACPLLLADEELQSREGYQVSAKAELSVCPILQVSELRAFHKAIVGSGNSATADDLERYVAWHIRSALREFARARLAEAVVDGVDDQRLAELGQQKTEAALFAAGLAIHQPLRATFQCEALTRRRHAQQDAQLDVEMQALRGKIDDALHAERVGQLHRLQGVFAEVRRLAETVPGINVESVLSHFDEEHRGALYHAMLQAVPPEQQVERIIVVAGNEIAWIDPRSPTQLAGRLDLGIGLGGARSLSLGSILGKPYVLVGAATGVHVLDLETLEPVMRLSCQATSPPKGGFNGVQVCGQSIFATHSELGLIAWHDTEAPGEPVLADRTADAKTVRLAMTDHHGRLIIAVDHKILVLDVEKESPTVAAECAGSGHRITALTRQGDDLYAGDRTGEIIRWSYEKDPACQQYQPPTGELVGSLQAVRLGGVDRLVIAADTPWVTVRVLRDTFATQYTAPESIYWASVAADLLIGVDASRRWLYTWHVNRPERPLAWQNIAQAMQHTIQAFLPV